MPPRPATKRQVEVLQFISDYHARHGYPPTMRELGTHFGWASSNAAAWHASSLVKRGLLTGIPSKARTLLLTSAGQALLRRAW
jgi:repressor LexA